MAGLLQQSSQICHEMNENNEWKVKQSIIDCEWHGRGPNWPMDCKKSVPLWLGILLSRFLFCLMNVDSSFLGQLTVKTNFHLDLTLPSCLTFDHSKMEKKCFFESCSKTFENTSRGTDKWWQEDKSNFLLSKWKTHFARDISNDGVCFQINFVLKNVCLSSD